MKTFKDIKFKQHQSGKGIHGKLTIENGMSLSVVAGQYFYSDPRSDVAPNGYSRFEVAIFDKDGEWATQKVLGKTFAGQLAGTEIKSTESQFKMLSENAAIDDELQKMKGLIGTDEKMDPNVDDELEKLRKDLNLRTGQKITQSK